MAEANFKMMQNAAEAFIPGSRKAPAPRQAPASEQADELAEMRAQMAAMQEKLDKMGK
jgi:polyhydroxyalkanoate synthesis regulator protein